MSVNQWLCPHLYGRAVNYRHYMYKQTYVELQVYSELWTEHVIYTCGLVETSG
jgi:hypothetical protein